MYRRSIMITAAAGLMAVLGCSVADGPTQPAFNAPDAASDGLLSGLTNGLTSTVSSLLVSCEPLPYRRVSKTITAAGGTIDIGPHKLVVPSGALSRPVVITAEIVSDDVNSIRFSPEGLHFNRQAQLTMSYANCRQLLPLPHQIVYTSEGLNILEWLLSTDLATKKTVSAPLDHFSRYAIAWRRPREGQSSTQ